MIEGKEDSNDINDRTGLITVDEQQLSKDNLDFLPEVCFIQDFSLKN